MKSNVKVLLLYFGTSCLTFIVGVGLVSMWAALRSHTTSDAQYADLTHNVKNPVRCAQSTLTHSPIRNVDFQNFTYPGWPIFGIRTTFTLRHGVFPVERDSSGQPLNMGLSGRAFYDDVTGDGIEDAIVGFSEDNSGGSAIVHAAYIYTLQRGRPIFLWGFEAGDRADGGLRSIYGQNGELVIELEGKDKIIGKNLYGSDDTSHGACCPTFFTRTRYRWSGRVFVQKGNSEVLPLAGAPNVELFPEDQFLNCDRH